MSGARELPLPHARRARALAGSIALAFDGQNLLLVWGDREPTVCPLPCLPNVLQVFAVRIARSIPLFTWLAASDVTAVSTSSRCATRA